MEMIRKHWLLTALAVLGAVVWGVGLRMTYELTLENRAGDGVIHATTSADGEVTTRYVYFDKGGAKYEQVEDRVNGILEERVYYDGGFLGFASAGWLGGAGAYSIVPFKGVKDHEIYSILYCLDDEYHRGECYVDDIVGGLPQKHSAIRARGRRFVSMAKIKGPFRAV